MKTKDEVKHALCDQIQARLEDLNLTQTMAANITGYTQTLFSDIKYHRTDYGIDTLIQILGQLGVMVRLEVVKVGETKGLPRLLDRAKARRGAA